MTSTLRTVAFLTIGGLALAGCADAGEEGRETGQAQDTAAPSAAAVATPAPPDTTAQALWAHLDTEAYRESWSLWPGTDRLYGGTEPHGMLLTTYVNQTARDALAGGSVTDLPPGSIIVKENYMPDSTFAAATVMYRVEGYNPEHRDWLFAKYDPQGTAEEFGRVDGCQSCHQQAETGYIYTAVQR